MYNLELNKYSNKFRELMNNPNSKNACLELLNNSTEFIIKNHILLMDFLIEVDWAFSYIENNLDLMLSDYAYRPIVIYTITKCCIHKNKRSVLEKLAYNKNLSIRAEFMKIIFEEYRNEINNFYKDDISSYFSIIDENGNRILMNEKDVSTIACKLFDTFFDENLYSKIKEFIFANYNSNHLASYIDDLLEDDYKPETSYCYEELMGDIDRYFETSFDHKYELLKHYGDKITSSSKEKYLLAYNVLFKNESFSMEDKLMVLGIHLHSLRDLFLEYIYKYYQRSESKEIIFKGSGSKSVALQIDDKVLKISDGKYVNYNIPEIFLILKNYEYYETRDKAGNITGTIEVQPCLLKKYDGDEETEILFRYELSKLGFFLADKFLSLNRCNCFYLNDYHDANCDDPESLPDWFKKKPLVLVDRDLVIPLEEKETFMKKIKKEITNIKLC